MITTWLAVGDTAVMAVCFVAVCLTFVILDFSVRLGDDESDEREALDNSIILILTLFYFFYLLIAIS